MPSDAGMAFVVIQHLPPDRESMVSSILAKHTQMPTHEVEDGTEVQPNQVYVIRPGRTMTIRDGRLHLGEPLDAPGHRRPVDDFFRSLAEEQRQRAICIIMSGMGSNGSSGAENIKAVGGLAIAQDPESAKFPSMPRHLLESGNADFVLRPQEMPEVLLRYCSHPYVVSNSLASIAARRDMHALSEILSVLRARTRRDFSGYKKPTVLRRIQRRMGLHQVPSLSEYATLLRQSSSEAPSLADDLMIHVTGFFRDAEAWEMLRRCVIDPLIAAREEGSSIRCWVTACSSGEDAYSLSMLLWEAAEAANKTFDIKVFATDTAERSLSRARTGMFPLGIEAEVSPERLGRFFDRDDAIYRVKKELRELVVFAPQNVIQDPPFSKLDICTCRNLLIYLEPELQLRVLALLHFGLREGGALFLGSSETVNGVEDLYETVDKRARIFRRIGPTRHGAVDFAFPQAHAETPTESVLLRTGGRLTVAQLTHRKLMDCYTPPAVTIDREHRVVYFHGDTAPYLAQPAGEPTRELLLLAREHLRGTVRAALDQAVTENRKATARDGVFETQAGRFRVEVAVEPLESKLASGYYVVTFHEVREPRPVVVEGGKQEVVELEAELARVRDELQSTIEELQTSSEEMRASNEETMSINEELQSTNEELETSKEELQSLNEELTTVNVQLQTKIEEHEATSNDLSSLLSSTDIAVIFLDTRFRIRRYTPAVKELVELIPSDVGRPLSDMKLKFADESLIADCQDVLERLMPNEKEIASDGGRTHVRRILPYRTLDNRINGVVITFLDVTAMKEADLARQESDARFRLISEGAPDFAIILMNPHGVIRSWNVGAENITGYSAEAVIGQSGSLIYADPDPPAKLKREIETAIHHGRAVDETWHRRQDGSHFWGSGVLTALRDSHGQLTGFVKILRDETARKRIEQQRDALLEREQAARREAENANHIKDQFLTRLSHELRTPLSSILIWSEMLQHKSLEEQDRQEGLQAIQRCAHSQQQLLDDLLDTARIASGKLRINRRVIEIEPLIRMTIDTIRPVAHDRGVELIADLPADCGRIPVDADRFRQILGNLLTNAVKFTRSGGRVTVSYATTERTAELRVADTGQGIEPDFLPYIFTPFSQADHSATRSYGGLGLGLAICRELVELHGGSIDAQSRGPGQGATFTVRLPLNSPGEMHTEDTCTADASFSDDAIANVRILLVEDDGRTADALTHMLTSYGAQVTAANSADAAVRAYQENRPDVIVSDIGLPGEDGFDLLRRIRALEAEFGAAATPAIALSAFAGRQHRRMAEEAGYGDYVAKPASSATLLAAISRQLPKRAAAGQTPRGSA
ncbi:MAG: PAS domain-containing protein, partial [Pirellulales bacterium]|nr:PAS domain-containing protein [Pirellulales bacterium]